MFTADGDLLFVAARASRRRGHDEPPPRCGGCPPSGGEAVAVLDAPRRRRRRPRRPRPPTSRLVTAPLLPSAADVDDDARLRALRKDNKVSAVLHTGYPVRHWDHDIGPAEPHLLSTWRDRRDLTPASRRRRCARPTSTSAPTARSPWRRGTVPGPGASIRGSPGAHRRRHRARAATIADDPSADLGAPGHLARRLRVAFLRESHSTPDEGAANHAVADAFGEELVTDRRAIGTAGRLGHVDRRRLGAARHRRRRRAGGRCSRSTPPTRGDAADPRRLHLHRRARRTRAASSSRCAVPTAAPPHPVRIDRDGTVTVLPCVDVPELPGELSTDRDGRRRRHDRAVLAGAARRATNPPRWCCGFTAARWAAGTPGTGGGTRGCWRRAVTPC